MNQKFELAARPVGMPKRTDRAYKQEPVREPGEGELLIKILYISLDPAMRGWMNEGKSYIGRIGGLFYYTWGSEAKEPDPYSVYRCGAITEAGKLALSPMQ